MRRTLMVLVAVLLGAGVLMAMLINTSAGQNLLLERALDSVMRRAPSTAPEGGLRVFMCGTASPLPAVHRAQACVAVQVDQRLFLVDAGAGSANVAALGNLPLEQLEAVLVTHFHSDHITGIGDFDLLSRAAGRPRPLQVIGPEGVARVVEGFNELLALDRGYREAHHGADLMPAALGIMTARAVTPGVIVSEGGLVIRAFEVEHDPASPAFGYRFEYGGRSVVVTGDTVVTQTLRAAAQGADLLLVDTLSEPIVGAMERAADAAGRERNRRFLADIQDYHASARSLAELARDADVGQLALYHLVPAPRNAVMKRIFLRDLPAGVVLTEDGMIFDLPAAGGVLQR